jgi:hypothetical protein
VVVALGAGCASSGGSSAAPTREYTPEEEMAAWEAVAKPGPEHARMAADAGEWTVASKAWMDPSAPPEVSTGSARIRMILDGRYQVMDYENSMMGMPFRGMGLTGYDNITKKYVGSWCDSMGTMIMISEGTRDPATGAVTMHSEWMDPLGRKVVSRQVSTPIDQDHMHWEMYCTNAGKPECKIMELDFTRKR